MGALLLPLALLALAWPASAREQNARVEQVRLLRGERGIVCDLLLTDLFTPPIESTLRSGLPVVIDVAVELRPAAGGVTGRLFRSELNYDVWEDRYSLIRAGQERVFADFEALREACERYRRQSLGLAEAPAVGQGFRLRLRVAVNPLGGAERRRMERWLARTVSDPGDPASRELRLDLGALIGSFFGGGGEEEGWGVERSFGPFLIEELPPADEPGTPEEDPR